MNRFEIHPPSPRALIATGGVVTVLFLFYMGFDSVFNPDSVLRTSNEPAKLTATMQKNTRIPPVQKTKESSIQTQTKNITVSPTPDSEGCVIISKDPQKGYPNAFRARKALGDPPLDKMEFRNLAGPDRTGKAEKITTLPHTVHEGDKFCPMKPSSFEPSHNGRSVPIRGAQSGAIFRRG